MQVAGPLFPRGPLDQALEELFEASPQMWNHTLEGHPYQTPHLGVKARLESKQLNST